LAMAGINILTRISISRSQAAASCIGLYEKPSDMFSRFKSLHERVQAFNFVRGMAVFERCNFDPERKSRHGVSTGFWRSGDEMMSRNSFHECSQLEAGRLRLPVIRRFQLRERHFLFRLRKTPQPRD
jgi:hypothetical protein